ncbi:MIP/aquaporin family protein [soil metagenome]
MTGRCPGDRGGNSIDADSEAKTTGGVREPALSVEYRARLAAEFGGAFLLVALVSGAATALMSAEATRLSSIEDFGDFGDFGGQGPFFESLLSSSSADLITVALAAFAALAIVLPAFMRISGGHFNPAVTFALAVTRRFPWIEVGPYVGAQFLGGIAGAFVVAAIFGQDGASIGSSDILFGAPVLAEGMAQWQALAAEATAALVVIVAIVMVQMRDHARVAPLGAGIVVGLAYAGGILVAGSVTGGSANPSRSLGPLIASLPFDVGSIPWGDLVVYVAGPLAGTVLGALAIDAVIGRKRPGRERPHDVDEEPPPQFIVGTTDRK